MLGLLTLAACDWITSPDSGEYRGIYVTAFEASGFRACRGTDYWWLSGELAPIFDVLPSEGPPDWSRAAYVHVRGSRSAPGRHGHLGAYKYELVVRRSEERRVGKESRWRWSGSHAQ